MFIPLLDRNKLKTIRFQSATLALLIANVAVYLGQLAVPGGGDPVYAALGFIPGELLAGAPHDPQGAWHVPPLLSLLTYGFVHGSWWHLGGNMLFLWTFADNVEDALGRWRFILFYLAGGAAAALAQGWFGGDPLAPFVGASGSVAACVGGYVLLYPRARIWILLLMRIPLPLPAYLVGLLFLATQFLFLALGADPTVGWSGHLGGFLAGLLLVILLRRRGVKLWAPAEIEAPAKPVPLVDSN